MVEDHGDRFVVPDCFALSLLSCSSVLMVLFGCVVVLVSIRSRGVSFHSKRRVEPCSSLCVLAVGSPDRYHLRLPDPLPTEKCQKQLLLATPECSL